jgi:predicted acyl esterase
MRETSEIRDGMRIDWDIPITMDDGLVLRADIFRPVADGAYPVLLSYGPYARWLAFEDGYKTAWDIMVRAYPDTVAGSTNKYQSWELVDPEKFVPDGYAILRVDSRGAGRSPGFIDPFCPRETQDLYQCIEWAAVQAWSNGRIGLAGISYYAINQWQVATLQPPHLAAMCVWEGAADWYRDMTHHGGMVSTFWTNWYDMQVKTVQHGLGENGPRSRMTGEWVCGPETLSEAELAEQRCAFGDNICAHPLDDAYHRERSPDWSKVTQPLLSCGNWGGAALHLRGNVEGYTQATSEHKWLELHGGHHWTGFYTDYGVLLQKQFFDYFLKGEDNGWSKQPAVQLQIRHADGHFALRHESEWPIARTNWTRLYLEPLSRTLVDTSVTTSHTIDFSALGDGVTFLTAPLSAEQEFTGPSSLRLAISSNTTDADLFVVLQVFAPDGTEVTFQGALDPHTPVAQGWLRASHRKLDPAQSLPYRPYHTHDEMRKLRPGEVVQLDIEIWPTCIVVPSGYRIGVNIRGRDYEHAGGPGLKMSNMKKPFTGCGPFLHDEPRDRPETVYGGTTTLHFGATFENSILLPVVPMR